MKPLVYETEHDTIRFVCQSYFCCSRLVWQSNVSYSKEILPWIKDFCFYRLSHKNPFLKLLLVDLTIQLLLASFLWLWEQFHWLLILIKVHVVLDARTCLFLALRSALTHVNVLFTVCCITWYRKMAYLVDHIHCLKFKIDNHTDKPLWDYTERFEDTNTVALFRVWYLK